MKTVAYLIYEYLPISETFIYEELMNMNNYKPIVITTKIKNLGNFYFSPIYSISNFPKKMLFKFFGKSNLFEKAITKNNARLIHSHFGHVALHILKIKNKLNLPMVTNFYGHDIAILRDMIKRDKGKNIKHLSNSEMFIVLSNDMKNDLIGLGFPEKRIKVLDVGIDLRKFKFIKRTPNKKIRILTIARFVEKKGIPYLIKAFARSRNRNNTKLDIIGDGPERKQIEELIQDLGLSENVNLLGYRPYDTLPSELYSSDIFVLPSITDSLGGKDEISTTIKQAMATGMPIIATQHAGIPEVIKDNKNGFIVPEKDIDALSKKIDYVIENTNIWSRIGKNARKTVEKQYDVKNQVRKLEKIYDSIIK